MEEISAGGSHSQGLLSSTMGHPWWFPRTAWQATIALLWSFLFPQQQRSWFSFPSVQGACESPVTNRMQTSWERHFSSVLLQDQSISIFQWKAFHFRANNPPSFRWILWESSTSWREEDALGGLGLCRGEGRPESLQLLHFLEANEKSWGRNPDYGSNTWPSLVSDTQEPRYIPFLSEWYTTMSNQGIILYTELCGWKMQPSLYYDVSQTSCEQWKWREFV